jgi:xanthine dehydrogenase/oxidase
MKVEGVVDVITYRDIRGSNIIGPAFKDEELFASTEVYFHGQAIAMVVAKDQRTAQRAAKLVKVDYEELIPIVSIEDAIAKQSFFELTRSMARGSLEEAFNSSDHVIEGEMRVGGQNHFYFETQASIVIPKPEDDEFEIWSSSQHPSENQHLASIVLGVASHKIVCRVKRMGGAFGGKESRAAPLSCMLAVAAQKLKRPVRCMLDRDEDMMMCGQRHPFMGKYKVGVKADGKVMALDMQLFSNAGYSYDLSLPVMERAVAHSDNAYNIPNIRVVGKLCKTNIHSNTAFRGFGGPQGMAMVETWITHVAEQLNLPIERVRQMNLYQEGDSTHYNQLLDQFQVPRLWNELYLQSQYEQRRVEISEYNAKNRWRKRGLAIIPTKFGIAFGLAFLNQAGALVHVYTDGSVLLTHGGTEMGQGLFTKCAQVCAEAFGIPLSQVHTSETATDKVANTSATAASAGSDLNGMAVLRACEQINSRLQPYRQKHPEKGFKEIVGMAYRDRVNLSANGFFATPDLTYDWKTNQGRLFNYFTNGVGVTEVEIDTLTGDFQVLRSDIMMDLGQSLNPAIDIGQIEGAFVQGMGWSTIEETLYFPNGALFTKG